MKRILAFPVLLLAACGGAEDGKGAAPAGAAPPPAAESPREAAERLTGLKFSKPPAHSAVDDTAFLDAAARVRGTSVPRFQLLKALGLLGPGDPAAQEREILAKEDLAAFHAPAENKIYEKKSWQPWIDYGRSPEYWRSHQMALVTRAYVVALFREHHAALRDAGRFPDDGIRLALAAAAEGEATVAVAPLIAAALIKETRREAKFREAREEEVRTFLLGDRLPISHLGKPASVEQAVAMWIAFDRSRNAGESSMSFLHVRQRQRQRSIAAAELEAARRRGPGGATLLADPAVSYTWYEDRGYGTPAPRTHLKFRTPESLLGGGWTLVEEGTLGHTPWGDRFALFSQGDRTAAVVCQLQPSRMRMPSFLLGQGTAGSAAVGGIYGSVLVAATGIDDAAFQETLPRILRSLDSIASDRFRDIGPFHLKPPAAPDPAAALARLKAAGRGEAILAALPEACQRHPDRAPAWIAEFAPAFLGALEELGGIPADERPLGLLGFLPHAVSPEAWSALLDAVAAAGRIEKSPIDGGDRYKIPGFFAFDDSRSRPGPPLRPPFSAFPKAPPQDRSGLRTADAALLHELRRHAAGTLAGMWILKHLDELKRLAQSGNAAQAVELARTCRALTQDPKALAGLDALLGKAATSAGIELWRLPSSGMRDPRSLLSGTTLFAAGGRQVCAIDLATGRELWKSAARDDVSGWTLWEGPEGILTVCGTGILTCWSKKDGSLLWENNLGRPVANAAVSGRMIVVEAPTLPAFDLSTGKPGWTLGADAQVLHGDGEGVLVRSSGGGEFLWLDPAGKERWRAPGLEPAEVRLSLRHGSKLLVRGHGETAELELPSGKVTRRIQGVLTPHATEHHVVLLPVTRVGEGFSVIDRSDGKTAWSKRSGQVHLLLPEGCGWSDREGFYWSDPATGRPKWAATLPSRLSFALAFPGTVVLATGYSLQGFDGATGAEQWKFATDQVRMERGWAVGDLAIAGSRSSLALIAVSSLKRK